MPELSDWAGLWIMFQIWGRDDIAGREKMLLDYATQRLSAIKGLRIYGNSAE